MTTHKIDVTCPECGYEADASTCMDNLELQPEAGDVGVCLQCAGVGFYYIRPEGTLGIRLATYDEKVQLSENEALTSLREMVLAKAMWFTP